VEANLVEPTAFPKGSTVVRRDVFRGQVWTAAPHRVIRDTSAELVLACWPGVEMLAPTTWIEWLRTGDDSVRKRAIPNLAAGRWALDRWVWRDTTLLTGFGADRYFSVSRFFDPEGRCGGWYVDFVCPCRRTPMGIDTFDLLRRPPSPPRCRRGLSANPGDVEDPDQLSRVVGIKAQQPITGAEHDHTVGRIIPRRYHGRIPGLINQDNHALQQRIECDCR
jgi:hypothetical protein